MASRRKCRTMIFEPFTRVQMAGESAEAGVGIGLALVKRLVELHGGTVSVESRRPWHGKRIRGAAAAGGAAARSRSRPGSGACAAVPGARSPSWSWRTTRTWPRAWRSPWNRPGTG